MTEEQKAIVLQQRAGYELVARMEIEAERKMTFADRLRAFARIQGMAPYVRTVDSSDEDAVVAGRWMKIRTAYESARR